MQTQISTQHGGYADRMDAIGEFIELLRAASHQRPLRAEELETAATAFEIALRPVPIAYITDRASGSILEICGQRGYLKATDVLAVFESGPGAEIRLKAQSERDAQDSQGKTQHGEGHQMLVNLLIAWGGTVPT